MISLTFFYTSNFPHLHTRKKLLASLYVGAICIAKDIEMIEAQDKLNQFLVNSLGNRFSHTHHVKFFVNLFHVRAHCFV